MKKLLYYLLVFSIPLSLLLGCSATEDKTLNTKTPIPVIVSDVTEKVDVDLSTQNNTIIGVDKSTQNSTEIDIDLSTLSSTMLYGEVSQMMWEPDQYVGKTIKIHGQYAVYPDEEKQLYYHAIIMADATACCAQGIEFKWLGEHKYPDEYPKEGADIEVVGIYKTYEDNGQVYFCIETDDIKVF